MITRAALIVLALWAGTAQAEATAPSGIETRCEDTAIPANCIVAQALVLAKALPPGNIQDDALTLAVELQMAYGNPAEAR